MSEFDHEPLASPRPAVLVTGAPATGKSTLARLLTRELGGALLDQDVATGPLVAVLSRLLGVDDLDDPVLAERTREARYETLADLAVDNLRAGSPVVLVAPFTQERREVTAWQALSRRLSDAGGDPWLVWISLPAQDVLVRLRARGAARDAAKLADEAGYADALAALTGPPAVPHLAVDGREGTAEQARRVLETLRR